MSDQHSHTSSHTSHPQQGHVAHELNHMAAEEHKAAHAARKVDSSVYMAQVLTSGNPKRIEKYFLRKFAYKLFGKFMGKTINRI